MARTKLRFQAKAIPPRTLCDHADLLLSDSEHGTIVAHGPIEVDIRPGDFVTLRTEILLHGFEFEGWAEVRYEPDHPVAGYPRAEIVKRLRIASPEDRPTIGAHLVARDLDTGLIVPFSHIAMRQGKYSDALVPVVTVPLTKEQAQADQFQRAIPA